MTYSCFRLSRNETDSNAKDLPIICDNDFTKASRMVASVSQSSFRSEQLSPNLHFMEPKSDDDTSTIASPTDLKKRKSSGPVRILGTEYVPVEHDVICGRGNSCKNHNGNVFLRSVIGRNLPNYLTASTKTDKSIVVSQIVKEIRNEGGNFVRQDEASGEWYQVSERALREKVGQCLRDALHHEYRSSTKAKKRRKKVENIQQHQDVTELLGNSCIMDKLADEIKDDTPDFQVFNMFNAANVYMLQELKRRMPVPPPE